MFDKIMDIVNEIAGGDSANSGSVDLGGFDRYLDGVDWPISKSDLISAMEQNGAGSDILGQVKAIDRDTFTGPGDLVGGLYGGSTEASQQIRTRVNELSPNLKDNAKKGNIL